MPYLTKSAFDIIDVSRLSSYVRDALCQVAILFIPELQNSEFFNCKDTYSCK